MARRARAPMRDPRSNLGGAGSVELKGLSEYVNRLEQLGGDMVFIGCVRSLGPGANLMRDAARARAPVLQMPDPRRKPGTLRDAITTLRVTKPRKFAVEFVVGIRLLSRSAVTKFKQKTGRDSKENPDDPFYGPILEMGRTERTRRQFLRPAFQTSAESAVRLSFDRLKAYTLERIRQLGAAA
jgi:hypothetical protein